MQQSLKFLRLTGVLVILVAIFLGPAPQTNDATDIRGRYQLSQAGLAHAPLLVSVADEAEADGCTAALGTKAVRDRIVLMLRCAEHGDLTITINHLPLGTRASRGRQDCRSAAAIRGNCVASGNIDGPLRGRLLTAFDRVFARVFPEDPFVIEPEWSIAAVLVGAGIAILWIFLWLVVSATFTYGSLEPGDWIALMPFVAALLVRESLALHSVQEIEIQFAVGPVGRHSLVYPLFQLFYSRLVGDPQAVTFHINGILGSVATVPLYLFVRQRTGDRNAAFVVGCVFAMHPLVARFAPTDAPYSFILVTWFSGLALLSAPKADALSTFGGAALLGLAASARMDGVFYLFFSALMLDPKLLLVRIVAAPKAACAGTAAIVLLIGLQMSFLLPFHWSGMHPDNPLWQMQRVVEQFLLQPTLDLVWAALLFAGAVAGIVRRWRLGLCSLVAFGTMQLFLQPSAASPNAWHHLIPIVALQCIVAGIGAVALVARDRPTWAAVLPGVVAALYVLLANRAILTDSYVFNDEYAMLRNHFAPEGKVNTSCDLFVMTRVLKDLDIRDFRRVVPGIQVIDCDVDDCVGNLTTERCQYYLRPAACYMHLEGVPPRCAEARSSDEDIVRECLVPECAAFESAADLTPVDERSLYPWITFADEASHYPGRIPVALFRTRPRARQGQTTHPPIG